MSAETENPPADKIPEIPGYRMQNAIGRGSMGEVFRAIQLSMDRPVAIKLLPRDLARNQEFARAFVKEARTVARLNHLNIVTGIDVGEVDGHYYFVMEFVDGQTVGDLLRSHSAIPERRAVEIIKQIASALEHARENGLVHRDVKPDNILLTREGTPKLGDLGLALSARDSGEQKMAGTPQYIAPEAVRREPLDTRSDIYSLGVTLFHMLAGEPPFEGTPREVLTKHITEGIPDLRAFAPSVSPRAALLVAGMTAREPDQRYQTPREVVEAAVIYLDHPQRAIPRPRGQAVMPTPSRGVARRHMKGSRGALTSVTAAALLGAGVLYFVNSQTAPPTTPEIVQRPGGNEPIQSAPLPPSTTDRTPDPNAPIKAQPPIEDDSDVTPIAESAPTEALDSTTAPAAPSTPIGDSPEPATPTAPTTPPVTPPLDSEPAPEPASDSDPLADSSSLAMTKEMMAATETEVARIETGAAALVATLDFDAAIALIDGAFARPDLAATLAHERAARLAARLRAAQDDARRLQAAKEAISAGTVAADDRRALLDAARYLVLAKDLEGATKHLDAAVALAPGLQPSEVTEVDGVRKSIRAAESALREVAADAIWQEALPMIEKGGKWKQAAKLLGQLLDEYKDTWVVFENLLEIEDAFELADNGGTPPSVITKLLVGKTKVQKTQAGTPILVEVEYDFDDPKTREDFEIIEFRLTGVGRGGGGGGGGGEEENGPAPSESEWQVRDGQLEGSGDRQLAWNPHVVGELALQYEFTSPRHSNLGMNIFLNQSAGTSYLFCLGFDLVNDNRVAGALGSARNVFLAIDPVAMAEYDGPPLAAFAQAIRSQSSKPEIAPGRKNLAQVVVKGDSVGFVINKKEKFEAREREFRKGQVTVFAIGNEIKIDNLKFVARIDPVWLEKAGAEYQKKRKAAHAEALAERRAASATQTPVDQGAGVLDPPAPLEPE